MLPNWQLLAEQVLFTSELLSNCIKILHSNKMTQNHLVLTEWAEWRETKKTAIDLIELIVPELRIKSFWQQEQIPIQRLGGFYPLNKLPSTIQKHYPVNSSPCIVQEHLWAINPSRWSLRMQGESKSKHSF